jgi:hypothetical protein
MVVVKLLETTADVNGKVVPGDTSGVTGIASAFPVSSGVPLPPAETSGVIGIASAVPVPLPLDTVAFSKLFTAGNTAGLSFSGP